MEHEQEQRVEQQEHTVKEDAANVGSSSDAIVVDPSESPKDKEMMDAEESEKGRSEVDNEQGHNKTESVPSPFFQGTVIEAIEKSKSANCLFVVSVQGNTRECDSENMPALTSTIGRNHEPSTQLDDQTWSHRDLCQLLASKAVALKLYW